MSKNKVDLIGNIGNDLELQETNNGTKLLKFSLATSLTYKNDKGEKTTRTEWHKIIMFGVNAVNTARYCKKGSLVALEGRLQTRSFETKDKRQHWITEIIAKEIIFLKTSGGLKENN